MLQIRSGVPRSGSLRQMRMFIANHLIDKGIKPVSVATRTKVAIAKIAAIVAAMRRIRLTRPEVFASGARAMITEQLSWLGLRRPSTALRSDLVTASGPPMLALRTASEISSLLKVRRPSDAITIASAPRNDTGSARQSIISIGAAVRDG